MANSKLKKAGIVAGGFAGILVAAAVIVPFVVDVDKYRPRIVAAANSKINGKVELGHLSLSLWGRVRVRAEGLKVTDAKNTEVLGVQEAFFDLPFMSILSGSPQITLRMTKPALNVVKDAQGKLNVTTLVLSKNVEPQAQASPAPGERKEEAKEAPSEVELPGLAARARLGIELRDATLTYKDATTGVDTKVHNLLVLLGGLSLSTPTELQVRADMDTKVGKSMRVKGPLKLDGTLKPRVEGGTFEELAAQLELDLDAMEIELPGIFHKKEGKDTRLNVSLVSGPKELKVEKLELKFFNAVVTASGVLANQTPPVADFKFQSNDIDLKPWNELVPMLKEYDLSGTAKLDGSANGPSDKLNYAAKLALNGITAKSPMLKAPARIDGVVNVATDRIENFALAMKAPGNDIALKGKVVSFTAPRAELALTSPGMDLDQLLVEAPKKSPEAAPAKPADKTAAKQPEGQAVKAPTAAPADNYDAKLEPLRTNPMLAAATADMTIDIKSLKSTGITLTAIQGKASVRNLVAKIDPLSFNLYGGKITSTAEVQLKPAVPTYQFTLNVSGVDLKQAVASQSALFKNTLIGKANVQVKGSGASFNPATLKQNLALDGSMKVTDAVFATIDVGRMAAEAVNQGLDRASAKFAPLKDRKVNVPKGRESKYESVTSDFKIAGGKFSAPNFVAKAMPKQGIDLNGRTEVGITDYSINARWELVDTQDFIEAKELSIGDGAGRVANLFAEGGGDKPVRFPVTVGCTLMEPCYSYTEVPEYLANVAVKNLTRGATASAKAAVQKEALKQVEKAVPDKAKEQVGNALKKLFGR